MTVYTVIESSSDAGILGVHHFRNTAEAWECFESCCQENDATQQATNFSNEIAGTLALGCGDNSNSYNVQLIEKPCN